MSPKLEKLPDSNFASGMLYGYNDSCKVSFQSVDVNLDFWHLSLCPPPAWRTTEKAGPDRVKSDNFSAGWIWHLNKSFQVNTMFLLTEIEVHTRKYLF